MILDQQKTLFEQGQINRDEYMEILAKRIAQNRTQRGMNRLSFSTAVKS